MRTFWKVMSGVITPGMTGRAVGTVGLALALSAVASPAPAGAADSVPYVDPAVTGVIGLCDVQGNNVTEGKITDQPFVWLAVGSSAAPAPYDQPGRTAFLTAHQPRKGIDPADWSGFQLAAVSRYTDVRHPMSQATPLSSKLTDFLGRYPAQWEGLVQLRLNLGGNNRPARIGAYDATDIRVTGDTWQVVRGGTAPCRGGSAVSSSVLLGVPGAQGTPKPGAIAARPTAPVAGASVPANGAGRTPTSASTGAGARANQGGQGAVGSGQGSFEPSLTRTAATAGARRAGTYRNSVLVGVGLAAGLAALAVVWALRRRRAG